MIIRNLENELQKEIEEKSERDKSAITFICDLIRNNEKEYSEVFMPEIKQNFEKEIKYFTKRIEEKGRKAVELDFYEKTLYFNVKNMIEELIKEEESGYGPIIISKNKIKKSSKSESPDRLLGLTEYIKIDERIFLKRPTEKGFEIINKYREIKGEKIICSIFFD